MTFEELSDKSFKLLANKKILGEGTEERIKLFKYTCYKKSELTEELLRDWENCCLQCEKIAKEKQ